jgi:hypothetical protein
MAIATQQVNTRAAVNPWALSREQKDLMKAKHRRYEALEGWPRTDLERHAVALTGKKTLAGATKIRLMREILLAEFPAK